MNRLKVYSDNERMRRAIYADLPDSGCTLHMGANAIVAEDGSTTLYRVVTDARDVQKLEGWVFHEVEFVDATSDEVRQLVETYRHLCVNHEVAVA